MDAPKLGDEEVLSKHFGKKFAKRTFVPPDGSEEHFSVFGGITLPVIILGFEVK